LVYENGGVPVVEIFYRADVPEQQRDEKTEYYSLVYTFAPEDSAFVLRQGHGWWDNESNCSRCDETVLVTVDSEAEVKRMYEEQRSNIIAMGFVYVPSGLWTIPAPASARG
jgi:hypothetical protein